MTLVKFDSKETIEVSNPKELKEVLKYCNPLMMNHYKDQLPSLLIHGFGDEIEIKRVDDAKE